MKIFLTQRAVKSYIAIKGYIENEFGEKVSAAFEQKIIDFLDLLENFPELGTLEVAEKQIRAF
jgi:plasmid stabilization system protein ParE